MKLNNLMYSLNFYNFLKKMLYLSTKAVSVRDDVLSLFKNFIDILHKINMALFLRYPKSTRRHFLYIIRL
jgi:hypothetical protein